MRKSGFGQPTIKKDEQLICIKTGEKRETYLNLYLIWLFLSRHVF